MYVIVIIDTSGIDPAEVVLSDVAKSMVVTDEVHPPVFSHCASVISARFAPVNWLTVVAIASEMHPAGEVAVLFSEVSPPEQFVQVSDAYVVFELYSQS